MVYIQNIIDNILNVDEVTSLNLSSIKYDLQAHSMPEKEKFEILIFIEYIELTAANMENAINEEYDWLYEYTLSQESGRVMGCSVNTRDVLISAVRTGLAGGTVGAYFGATTGTFTVPVLGTATGAVGGFIFGLASGFVTGTIGAITDQLISTCGRGAKTSDLNGVRME